MPKKELSKKQSKIASAAEPRDEITGADFKALKALKKKEQQEGKHDCATHVEHRMWGQGRCISESHADPDRYGNVAWYDVQFNHGVERGVPINEMNVLMSEMHHHGKKNESVEIDSDELYEDVIKYISGRRYL
jgi:hypothetical protein